jgi:LDH2 family malate/lactate/ureidoglycolate dehydrogenase
MRHDAQALVSLADDLLRATGLSAELSRAVSTYLVEADLMGHDTHGLALLPWYLGHIRDGIVPREGSFEVMSDKGAAICWNGKRLPGQWLTEQAVLTACARSSDFGTATVVIGNSHHNGALAVYLRLATERGLLMSIASSSPSGQQVAPFGGVEGRFTPNPVAWGIPMPGSPALIDISASITTANMCARMVRAGREYEKDWLLDADGNLTRDPKVIGNGGSLLPTGGLDHGQKGYGMALSVEALTQGLAGYGRADEPSGTNSAITVSVYDPEAFGGLEAFLRQTGWLAEACLATRPLDLARPVRLPGQAALARRAKALSDGLSLYPGIFDALAREAEALGVALPAPLN